MNAPLNIETPQQATRRLMANKLKEGYAAEALHTYTDIEGNPLYWRIRLKHPTLGKYMRPMALIDGVYMLKEPPFSHGEKPLYNLHKLETDTDKVVFIVEGEKCADALIKLGLLATTSGGADSVKATNWQILAGREVVIWPDNDNAGIKFQTDLFEKLHPLNCKIKCLDVETLNLPAKGDCVDWLADFERLNNSKAESHDIHALSLVDGLIQAPTSDYIQAGKASVSTESYHATVSLQCASNIEPEAINWLWNGWLARGKLHIFAGAAGTGKTTIAIELAATITIGGRFPDETKSQIGSVLIWSGEDSPADTLVPRLMAAGADLSKVHFIGDTTLDYEKRSFDPATDMQALMLKAASIPDLALLIIDPIVNAVAGDSHKNGEVRRALQPVVDFGEKLNCAVLGITHFSKGGLGKDPLERVTGSLAFGALARIVFATAKINDGETTRRIFCRAKSNIGIDSGGFEYDLQQKEVKQGIFSSYALWGEAIEGSARELLAEPDHREAGENNNSALDDAKDFLRELLADNELAQKEIEADAKGAGLSWRTVERAKKELYITSSKSKLDKRWYWKLPSNSANFEQDRQDSHINNVADMADLPSITHIPDKYPAYEGRARKPSATFFHERMLHGKKIQPHHLGCKSFDTKPAPARI